jgi:hypothetical protein
MNYKRARAMDGTADASFVHCQRLLASRMKWGPTRDRMPAILLQWLGTMVFLPIALEDFSQTSTGKAFHDRSPPQLLRPRIIADSTLLQLEADRFSHCTPARSYVSDFSDEAMVRLFIVAYKKYCVGIQ